MSLADLEERQLGLQWRACASRLSTLTEIVVRLQIKAAEYFIADKSELAAAFKQFANTTASDAALSRNRLNEFIAEDDRRRQLPAGVER